MNAEIWHCEGCGDEQTGEPAAEETHAGHRETISLWFCADCARR